MLEGAWERGSELGTFCQHVMLIDGHCTVVTVFTYSVMEGSKLQLRHLTDSKLQLDTWEAIQEVVYANKALPAIVDIKASGLINYSCMV